MKKILFVLSIILASFYAEAQVRFEPGIRTGVNYSRFSQIESSTERFTPKADIYVGIYGKLQLSKLYAMIPTVTYTRQGSNKEIVSNGVITKQKLDVNYIGVSNVSRFTFGKVSILAGPSIDFLMKNNKKELGTNGEFSSNKSIFNDVDLAVIIGAQYDITDALGVEFRLKSSLSGASYSYNEKTVSDSYYPYTVDDTIYNIVYQLGVTYTFKKSNKEK